MYEEFYQFTGKPFQLSPDPRFFYSSTGHKRAMAYMQYGLQQEQGFIIVSGDVGTGKSMLVGNLFNSLDKDRLIAAKIVSTNVQSSDLIRLICSELGIPHERRAKATLLKSLEDRFRESAEDGKHVLLVIDEAQNLPRDSLEELRMLSNFEHNSKPLVQSFLLGQREFRRTLRAPGLEQLRQRVIAAYHLGPLSKGEIGSYIKHRLNVVGWQDDPELDDAIYEEIHKFTRGVPRRINTFFDRLLLTSYLDEKHSISVDDVLQVSAELEQEVRPDIMEDEISDLEREPLESTQPPVAQSAAKSDPELNKRLERVEKQLATLTTQLSVSLTANRDPRPPADSSPLGLPRWTLAFLGLSVSATVAAIALGYFFIVR